jgi:hypothetical protein
MILISLTTNAIKYFYLTINKKKELETARNLEVGQGVGDSKNRGKKAAGHIGISFAKMAKLLEYCGLVNS